SRLYHVFFFSSRRRHTRLVSDWSSDVCSSDLKTCPDLPIHPSLLEEGRKLAEKGDIKGATAILRRAMKLQPDLKLDPKAEAQRQIGRASCRERVKRSVGGV